MSQPRLTIEQGAELYRWQNFIRRFQIALIGARHNTNKDCGNNHEKFDSDPCDKLNKE